VKIAFWGGPLDGEIREMDRPHPIRYPLPTIETVGWADAPDRIVMTGLQIVIYVPRQVRLEDRRTWWVMVPDDASAEERESLLVKHGHPPIDTRGRGLRYIEKAL
jgi:hypothetical protein